MHVFARIALTLQKVNVMVQAFLVRTPRQYCFVQLGRFDEELRLAVEDIQPVLFANNNDLEKLSDRCAAEEAIAELAETTIIEGGMRLSPWAYMAFTMAVWAGKHVYACNEEAAKAKRRTVMK